MNWIWRVKYSVRVRACVRACAYKSIPTHMAYTYACIYIQVYGKLQHDYEWLQDQDIAISCTDLDNRVTGPIFNKSKLL